MQRAAAQERAMVIRALWHVLGGLLAGGLAGYVIALVAPRRYPVPEGAYHAPVPRRTSADAVVNLREHERAAAVTDLR